MVRVRCPQCQTVLDVHSAHPVCPTCGFRGNPVPAGPVETPPPGSDLPRAQPGQQDAWQPAAPPQAQEPRRGRAGLVVGILLALVFLVAAAAAAYHYYGPGLPYVP